jgi:hypothetical protein
MQSLRGVRRLVPLALREAAEGDQLDRGDDQPEPEAPDVATTTPTMTRTPPRLIPPMPPRLLRPTAMPAPSCSFTSLALVTRCSSRITGFTHSPSGDSAIASCASRLSRTHRHRSIFVYFNHVPAGVCAAREASEPLWASRDDRVRVGAHLDDVTLSDLFVEERVETVPARTQWIDLTHDHEYPPSGFSEARRACDRKPQRAGACALRVKRKEAGPATKLRSP